MLFRGRERVGALDLRGGKGQRWRPDQLALLRTASGALGAALGARLELERLKHLPGRDAVTGLPDSKAFQQRLIEEVARAERGGLPVSVVVLDLDHFNGIDRRYGRAASDAMLAEFARPQAIPLLAQALDTGGPHADAAARALARHPQAAAGRALRTALARPDPAIGIAAADGLLLRADRRDCPALRVKLTAPDDLVRYHVLQAAGQLGCMGPEELARFAEHDPSEDIRSLAVALQGATPSREPSPPHRRARK